MEHRVDVSNDVLAASIHLLVNIHTHIHMYMRVLAVIVAVACIHKKKIVRGDCSSYRHVHK